MDSRFHGNDNTVSDRHEAPGGTMTTLKTRLAIKRLHPLFVAEVTGIDLTVPIPHEDKDGSMLPLDHP
jgi:hypothetical protein